MQFAIALDELSVFDAEAIVDFNIARDAGAGVGTFCYGDGC